MQSVAKAATEEVAKIDTESAAYLEEDEAEDEEEAAGKRALPEPLMRAAAAAVALAAAVTLAAITPIGPWIAREVEIVGAMVAKVSAVVGAVVEKIPWPQPVHGEEGLWETITILLTSVIVRRSCSLFQVTAAPSHAGGGHKDVGELCVLDDLKQRDFFYCPRLMLCDALAHALAMLWCGVQGRCQSTPMLFHACRQSLRSSRSSPADPPSSASSSAAPSSGRTASASSVTSRS